MGEIIKETTDDARLDGLTPTIARFFKFILGYLQGRDCCGHYKSIKVQITANTLIVHVALISDYHYR